MDPLAPRTLLRDWQNPDGGWGYFPRRKSWLEPTAFAALALASGPACAGCVRRAWSLVRGWQNPDGGWRPNASVAASTWATSLALILGDAAGEKGSSIDRGVDWLIAESGAESSMLNRILRTIGISHVEREVKHRGWPWRSGNSAWVEPTAHALVALRRVGGARARERVDSGEQMLLTVRCSDGGWNYGSPRALGIPLASYPETTALAIVGLGRRSPPDAVERARGLLGSGALSPLAHVWMRLALRLAGQSPGTTGTPMTGQGDVLLTALDCLGADDGNWRSLAPGERA